MDRGTRGVAQGHIYTVDADGGLRRMARSAPESEDRMQTLVARYPELITDGDGDLLLIRREHPIADNADGAGRWSVDHLFVTSDAVPVLVELKRAVDTRLRREVVGQLLDYAANATAYWQTGRIADSFEATTAEAGLDPAETLASFVGDREPEEFWAQVDANFKAGRIKLVFVADEIPRELARIVEFLNDQMRADIRAIELRWFSGEGGVVALSPRVIGETERAAAMKVAVGTLPPISPAEWLQNLRLEVDSETIAGADAFAALIERSGGTLFASPKPGGALAASFEADDGKAVTPLRLWKRTIDVPLSSLQHRRGLTDDAERLRLLDDLARVVGPMSSSNLRGLPSFRAALLANATAAHGLEDWLRDWLPRMRE